jgi:cytochrome P460
MRLPLLITAFAALPVLGCSGLGCSEKPARPLLNQQAALAGALPHNPLQWKVITSSLNRGNSTMSTLYGNDIAVQYARSNADHNYPPGAVLSLVTWGERDDPHWFGARIPSDVKSVEFVTVIVTQGKVSDTYAKYQGSPLKQIPISDNSSVRAQIDDLLTQRAAVVP